MIGKIILFIWMTLSLYGSFLFTRAASGFPGESSRILFFHVPMAWIATLAFALAMVSSVIYLMKKKTTADHFALASSELGFFFCFLATITGSIFAKITWGSYWNWDPRETSIIILLLIYGAYFALRSAVTEEEKKRTYTAAYSILAFATVPFLIFIVPRITLSLHPEDTMNPANPGMDGKTLLVFVNSLFVYTAVFFYMLRLRFKTLKIEQEIDLRQNGL